MLVIEPRVFKDARGYFFESFSQREFDEKVGAILGHKINFVQDNESMSSYGVMRGLHFQRPPFTQSKIVRCVKGSVLEEFEFDKNVNTIDDLVEGMILPGIVTNITNFGAFVDIGVHQDGLIHVSQMANRRIAHPTDVVKLHQHLKVRVIEVDHRRHRISLSLK